VGGTSIPEELRPFCKKEKVMRYSVGYLGGFALFMFILPAGVRAQEKDLDKIPKAVMESLKAKFPKAKIDKWTKETEGGKVVYDIEFKQDGRKFEADIFENGTIENWEREIAADALPEAVKNAVEKKYPKATLKEILETIDVKDGKDKLSGYEVVLETADKKSVEVTVAPDGKILEDSTEKKK
jgi:uncharacterized membrane protein YkoI